MKRREFITLLGGAAAWPRAARAQKPERMRRIGVLMSFGAHDPEAQSRAAAFENGLRQLGWVRGHNLSIEYRWADNPDVLRTYATELVGMAPDLILVNSTPAIAALQEQRQAVPIVFTQVTDPVGEGLVLNLAHPGGHVTGFTHALFVGLDPFLTSRRVQLATLATRHVLPMTSGTREIVEAGGLMSYGGNIADAFRQMGVNVGRILKGAKLADLPVVQASKFELVFNAETARMLGLTIPPTLLAIADEVIE